MPATAHAGSHDKRALSTAAGRQLLRLFDARTQARPWRLSSQPLPIIVLEAAEPGVQVDDYVRELERAAAEAGIGTIDFTHDQHTLNGSGHRGLTLVKVTIQNGGPVYRPVCGRMNGGLPVRGLPACP